MVALWLWVKSTHASPGAMFSYEHSLLAILTITDHNRTTGVFNILHAEPCPANRVRMIEIILLFTISFVIAGIQQRVNRIFYLLQVLVLRSHNNPRKRPQDIHPVAAG